VTDDMVEQEAESLGVHPPSRRGSSSGSFAAAASVTLLGSLVAIGAITLLYQRSAANEFAARAALARARDQETRGSSDRTLPPDTPLTIAAGSFALSRPTTAADVRALTDSLESSGFHVYYSEVDNGRDGRWQRVLVGTYTNLETAHADADLLKRLAPTVHFRVVSGPVAAGVTATTGWRE
jgi:SPOR domain